MVGLDHGPSHAEEPEDEVAAARNARLGHKLFLGYLALYLGYVVLVAFRPDLLRQMPLGGMNLAVLYGIVLIAAAILLSFLYGWLCRVPAADRVERA